MPKKKDMSKMKAVMSSIMGQIPDKGKGPRAAFSTEGKGPMKSFGKRKTLAAIALMLLLPSLAHAQTITRTAMWVQPSATPVEASAYKIDLKMDALPSQNPTAVCVLNATNETSCSAPFVMPANLTPGPHTVVLTVTNALSSATASLTSTAPSVPIKFTFTFTISIP